MKTRIRIIGKDLLSIGLIALLVLAARSSLADHYAVPTGSMEYTMMPGDRIVVNKAAYGVRIPFTAWKFMNLNPVTRGDVVIFDSPEEDLRLVKRVVAVGGDTVAIRGGRVSINGARLMGRVNPPIEIYGSRRALLNLSYGGGFDMKPTPIPRGYVLTIGDFRGNSRDGRIFGLIPEHIIYGRAVAVYYRQGDGLMWRGL